MTALPTHLELRVTLSLHLLTGIETYGCSLSILLFISWGTSKAETWRGKANARQRRMRVGGLRLHLQRIKLFVFRALCS